MAAITSFTARSRKFYALMFSVLCASGLFVAYGDIPAAGAQPSDSTNRRQAPVVRIQMTLEGTVIATATLDNNNSARQFAALLPLNLNLKDYAATEKVADLPGPLSTKGAPEGYTPVAGDISYYAPWGNLAIYHKDFAYSTGLVRLGRLDSGLDAMRRPGAVAVRIELTTP